MAKEFLEKLSTFVEQTAADLPEEITLECKHFFSGAALYAEKRICITFTPVGLAMKLPEKTRVNLFKNHQGVPLKYFPKAPIKKEYVLFPDGVTKRLKTLQKYAKESIAYVLTLPKPKKK